MVDVGFWLWLRHAVSSVLLTFGIFSFHEDFHRFPFAPELSLCSRLFSGFDFVLILTLFFYPIFLRASVPPCCKPAVVGLRGEYWVLVVAPPRCGFGLAFGSDFQLPITNQGRAVLSAKQ